MFGASAEMVYGKGVNVYADSGWGTEYHARRIADEQAFHHQLLAEYPLLDHHKYIVVAGIRRLRDAFVGDFFHRLNESRGSDWRLMFSALGQEPQITFRVLPVVELKLLGKG